MQLIAVLQGITGFASNIIGGDVSGVLDTALGIAKDVEDLPCFTSLKIVIKNAKAWLTFGKYRPLNDSSDLDFDKMNVSSVPDMMKVCNSDIVLFLLSPSTKMYLVIFALFVSSILMKVYQKISCFVVVVVFFFAQIKLKHF